LKINLKFDYSTNLVNFLFLKKDIFAFVSQVNRALIQPNYETQVTQLENQTENNNDFEACDMAHSNEQHNKKVAKPQKINESIDYDQKKTNNVIQLDLKLKIIFFQLALEQTYFNTCSLMDDFTYNSLMEKNQIYGIFKRDSLKNQINAHITNYLDKQISTRVTHSPLFSLVLLTDDNLNVIFVFIEFLGISFFLFLPIKITQLLKDSFLYLKKFISLKNLYPSINFLK
jgi:hypothetical protein